MVFPVPVQVPGRLWTDPPAGKDRVDRHGRHSRPGHPVFVRPAFDRQEPLPSLFPAHHGAEHHGRLRGQHDRPDDHLRCACHFRKQRHVHHDPASVHDRPGHPDPGLHHYCRIVFPGEKIQTSGQPPAKMDGGRCLGPDGYRGGCCGCHRSENHTRGRGPAGEYTFRTDRPRPGLVFDQLRRVPRF